MRMLLLIALVCAPLVYAQSGQGPRHPDSALQNQDDPVRLPAPKKGEAAIKDGEDAFAEGRMDDAVAHFTVAIDAQPENDELYAYRAAAYVALGKLDEAGEDIDEAVRLESAFSLTWNTRGYIAWMRGQNQDAVEHYTTAIAYAVADRRVDEGGLAQIYQNRGVAWQDLGNTDRALLDFNECVERAPDNPAYLENRGLVYVDKQLFDMAFLDFDRAVELDKQNARVYVNRAYAARQMGDYEQAVRDYSQALRLREDYGQALIGRGYTWMAWGQLGPARKDFNEAKELDVTAAAETGLGQVALAEEDIDTALALFRETLVNDSAYIPARRLLALTLIKAGELEQAQTVAQELCRLDPASPTAWYAQGKACAELGRHEDAVASFNRALELDPANNVARRLRARCYARLGNFKLAFDDADRVLASNEAAGRIARARIHAIRANGEIDRERVLHHLQKAAELGASVSELAGDSDFDALKDEPRFKKLTGAE